MDELSSTSRTMGLLGATGVGVGAIVGGGILALAGVAFAETGPSAILAFAFNGLIALITALSFAELSAAFPTSGGTYVFSKRVLSVEAAFVVGWIVWFASIVAAVLYALGFGFFALVAWEHVEQALAWHRPEWLAERVCVAALALAATVCYTGQLLRRRAGGKQWANLGKVAVFGLLIAAGLWALPQRSGAEIQQSLRPFFPGGALGLFRAMGFTFIALQGFDLIAAVAGEVRNPARNIPRAMFLSLGIALAIYLPLLLVVMTVGLPAGGSIATAAAADPEAIIATAARNYLGRFGYWLVIVAAVLSMLSALQANLLAASRIAQAMAGDRTLPHVMARVDPRRGIPRVAVLATAALVAAIVVVLSDVAAAGAASSLIFLVTFALVHWISILARQRSGSRPLPFRAWWFPLFPVTGAAACVALALFEGFSVPQAGLIAGGWIAIGAVLYLGLFARRARIVDASSEALDPSLLVLRGRSPLVLVPLANPANAEAMVSLALALAPPQVGRVLLLSVVVASEQHDPQRPVASENAHAALDHAISASIRTSRPLEMLSTVSHDPWLEIGRVARTHRCAGLLLGLSQLDVPAVESPLESLLERVESDVFILRAPQGWRPDAVRRILVPLGGQGGHDQLRARLLGSLLRTAPREVCFLRIVPEQTPPAEQARIAHRLRRIARDEAPGHGQAKVLPSNTLAATLAHQAEQSDLLILGLQRASSRRRVFGQLTLQLAQQTTCPILIVGRRT